MKEKKASISHLPLFSFEKLSKHYFILLLLLIIIIQPARCYWQTVPSQWGGGRLFGASVGSPHENGRNSGTKSRRLDPLVSKFS